MLGVHFDPWTIDRPPQFVAFLDSITNPLSLSLFLLTGSRFHTLSFDFEIENSQLKVFSNFRSNVSLFLSLSLSLLQNHRSELACFCFIRLAPMSAVVVCWVENIVRIQTARCFHLESFRHVLILSPRTAKTGQFGPRIRGIFQSFWSSINFLCRVGL